VFPTGGAWQESVHLDGEDWMIELDTGTAPPWRFRGWREGRLEVDETSPPGEPGDISNGTFGETEYFISSVERNARGFVPSVSDGVQAGEWATLLERIKSNFTETIP